MTLMDSFILIDVSPRSNPHYNKHGLEILELGSFHNSKLGSLTTYTNEEEDIGARLELLEKNIKFHDFQKLALDVSEEDNEEVGCKDPKYFPQCVRLFAKRKRDLFEEWMDNLSQSRSYTLKRVADVEVKEEYEDHMDEDPKVLVLREGGTHEKLATIIDAITKLKNWAWKGVAHPIGDPLVKTKPTKSLMQGISSNYMPIS